jgi:hypothetical protein
MLDPLPEAQRTANPVGEDRVDHTLILESFPADPQRWGYAVMALLVAVTFASLLGSLVATPDIGSPADRYMSAYGGDRSTYERILSSNCASLQEELDRATNSNAAAELGSVWHLTTLGYMAAAEDLLNAADCVD